LAVVVAGLHVPASSTLVQFFVDVLMVVEQSPFLVLLKEKGTHIAKLALKCAFNKSHVKILILCPVFLLTFTHFDPIPLDLLKKPLLLITFGQFLLILFLCCLCR
jgi:hypothetical protein